VVVTAAARGVMWAARPLGRADRPARQFAWNGVQGTGPV